MGLPGWISPLSVCLQLSSWFQGPGIKSCIRLPAQWESLLLPLSVAPHSCALSLCQKKKLKKEKKRKEKKRKFIWYVDCYPSILFMSFSMINDSPPPHFPSGGVFSSQMSLLYTAYRWVLVFIQSDTLCPLIGVFSQFAFRVTIERYEFSAIVLPVRS